MTTATRETANLPGPCPGAERMVWPVQTHPAQSTGPESKRNSGDGEYFSLDFSFYRTALPSKWIPPDRPAALFRKPHLPTIILSEPVGALHWAFSRMTVESHEIAASQRAFCRERNAHFQNAPGESKLGFALATEGSRRFRCENSRMRDRGPSDEIAASDREVLHFRGLGCDEALVSG